MSDCTCDPRYLLEAAEAALSPRAAEARCNVLFQIAPNPYEEGRINQKQAWIRAWTQHAERLIWA